MLLTHRSTVLIRNSIFRVVHLGSPWTGGSVFCPPPFFLCISIFVISLEALIRLHDALRTYVWERNERTGERKRTTTTKQNTSNSLVEDVTPQILSLGTKPFVIFTDALFKVDAYF